MLYFCIKHALFFITIHSHTVIHRCSTLRRERRLYQQQNIISPSKQSCWKPPWCIKFQGPVVSSTHSLACLDLKELFASKHVLSDKQRMKNKKYRHFEVRILFKMPRRLKKKIKLQICHFSQCTESPDAHGVCTDFAPS